MKTKISPQMKYKITIETINSISSSPKSIDWTVPTADVSLLTFPWVFP